MSMKHLNATLVVGVFLAATGCGDDDGEVMPGVDAGPGVDSGPGVDAGPGVDSGPGVDAGPTGCPPVEERSLVMVTGEIDADTTWTCDNLYRLDSPVYVTAVLTLEEGVHVHGNGGPNGLIVTTMGRLEATGTAAEPIVFTSANPAGSRTPGDWGGVVLLGTAPINVAGGTNTIEGLDPGETRGTYGGTNGAHDCGTLSYARIEFAGFVFGEDNELNGLTLGGCGAGTTLDHIQVHAGTDDGIEFFGGTADISYAVVSQVQDDGLDTDQGWQGMAQFLIVQQDASGDRGFEMDNLEADFDAMPRSKPVVWNATLVGGGGDGQHGMRLRHGTAGQFGNIIVMNFDMGDCVGIQHDETGAQVTAGELTLSNSILFECTTPFNYRDMTATPTVDFETDTAFANTVGTDPMLANPLDLDGPSFAPMAGADLTTHAGTPPAGDTSATFIGAIDPAGDDWTVGWTAFPVD
jgi:hypothetical protein